MKLIVIGDGDSHKKELLISYACPDYDWEYIPSVFDNYLMELQVNGKPLSLGLWDTSGQEFYDRLRPISYANTDFYLLVFNLVSPISLQNIVCKWWPEINRHAPNAKCILVGTHTEEIQPEKPRIDEQIMALKVAIKIKALDYLECSVFDRKTVCKVFDVANKYLVNKNNQDYALEATKEASLNLRSKLHKLQSPDDSWGFCVIS